MASLNRNIFANLAGGLWIAALTVIITPMQIRLLGVEAYGLVGLITVLQIVLGACDLGLAATITQRVAADRSHDLRASAALINSAATVYWAFAAAIGTALWLGSPNLGTQWLKPSALDEETVAFALQTIAFYLALRWPVAFYSGLLSGLQRMGTLNLLKAGAISVRLLGGVAVLLWRPDLRLFLSWFAISALLELLAYALTAMRTLPGFRWRPMLSWPALKEIWRFSAAMSLIAALSVLLTQLDRLIIGKLLGLESLGYYMLAYNTALALSLLQTAFNNAALPAFSAAHGQQDHHALTQRYEKTSQLMGYALALPCGVLVFFGSDLLTWWINPASASGAALPMALLAFGFFLNALVSNAYIMAVACGKPQLPLRVNLLGAALYLPLLYVAVLWVGPLGAASAWIALNLYYFATLFPSVQRGLLQLRLFPWLMRNVLAFLVLGAGSFGGMKWLAEVSGGGTLAWAALFIATLIYAISGFRMLSPALRRELSDAGKRTLSLAA